MCTESESPATASVTLPGVVEKVIESPHPAVPEGAQIAVEGADDLYRKSAMKQKTAGLSPQETRLLTAVLRSSAHSTRFLGVRHYAMLLVADCARLHFNELLSLRMFQVNGAVIQSLDGFKGVLLNPEAQSALNAYLELRSKLSAASRFLFVGLNGGPLPSKVMRNRVRKFGLLVLGREIEPELLLRGLRQGTRFDLSRLKEIHRTYHPRGKSA